MTDLGLTHIALTVTDVDQSIEFYTKYAHFQVVHRRTDAGTKSDVAWISDLTRPFVIVLLKVDQVSSALLPNSHLGVACATREEVDRLCDMAKAEGVLIQGPTDSPPPVGYWAYLRAPDGHTLELSYGQEVGFTVEQLAGQQQSSEFGV
jgi:catechol 2,3-dioxygenase-like lactoylglutathione lyase family enzyme